MLVENELKARSGTLGFDILTAAQKWPNRIALILGNRQASYKDFADETVSYASSLIALGVKRGDHVGILMPNSWEYVILTSAINLIGACAVVLNARYRGDELQYVVGYAEISILITTGSARPNLDFKSLLCSEFPELISWNADRILTVENAPKLRKVFLFNDPDEKAWPTEVSFFKGASTISNVEFSERVASVRPDENAMMIFSSGTTSKPKACMISHRVMSDISDAIATRLELSENDVLWDPLPLYHLSSHLPLNACRQVGATYVSQTHFNAGDALEELERTGATICYAAFPALMADIIDHPAFRETELARLRLMLNIGEPELLRKFSAALPQATQIACYGLTESGGISAMSSPHDSLEERVSCVGRPLNSHKIRIVDPETLQVLPQGVRGEILISGALFSGYFKDKEQTQNVFLPDGWLRSGDAGWLDKDGNLIYAGRIKDMLKIGGENVAAVEIESFLVKHPSIKLVQVISVPDERLMEVAAAFVELKSGETLTEEELIQYCVGRLASFKIPRYVRFVKEWPMGATKIQKFKLKDHFIPTGKIDVAVHLGKSKK